MPAIFKSPYSLAALAGAITPLAFAPFSYWVLLPLSLALLMWLQFGRSPKQAFLLGTVFGTAGFLGGIHWVYISTHIYSGAPQLLALLLVVLLASYLSLYGAGVAALAAYLGGNRFWPWLLAYVSAWPLAELLRNQVFNGFTWLSLGYSHTDTWLSGLAPYLGVFGLIVPILLMAALPLAWRERQLKPLLAAVLACWGLGWAGQQPSWTQASGAPLKVGLVQANVEQADKWVEANRWPTARSYYRLTEQVISEADLVIWPEVAVPGAYRTFYTGLFKPLQRRFAEEGNDLLAGVMRWDDEREQYANSVVQLNSQLADGLAPRYYDKLHLVPFAEFFPVPDFVRGWLKDLELPYSDLYTDPDNYRPFQVGQHQVAVAICFEDVFGDEIAALATDAGLLVSVSNDAWFGRSIAAAQHEQIARMRAIELQRWLVRSTPTGYSAFINPAGKVVQQLPRFEAATAVAELQPRVGLTPYMMIRNHYLWLFMLPLLWLAWRRFSASSR